MKAPAVDVPFQAQAARIASRCRNCRAALLGPYCARCGQREVDLNVSTRELVKEGVQEFVAIDRRFFRTLRLLFVRPGHLTRVYLCGRRVRHTSPLRLYLVASVLFFSAYVLTQDVRESYTDAQNPGMVESIRQLETSSAPGGVWRSETRSLLDRLRDFGPTLQAGNRRAVLDRGAFINEYSKNLSRALLVAFPVLSLILGLVYFRSGRPLVQHLIFSFHFGAVFLFGFLVLMMAGVLIKAGIMALGVSAAEVPYVNTALYGPGGFALLVYLYLSMRRVYRERGLVRVARFGLAAVLFAGSLATAFLVAVVYTTLMLG